MPEYVLDHHAEGERQRLALMSRLLDPMHRRYLDRLGAGPGARTLEAGCGNGSVSAWLAGRIAPGGQAVAGRILQMDSHAAGYTVVLKMQNDKLTVVPYHAIQRIDLA